MLQVYPTAVRTFGLGVANMCARLGAALAPFFAVYLVRHNLAPLAEICLAVACFLAAAVSLCILAEPAGDPVLVSLSVSCCRLLCCRNPSVSYVPDIAVERAVYTGYLRVG